MKLDIIIPIYNNEKQLLNIYNKINDDFKDIKHTFIFVDDNSEDKSLETIKNIQKNDDENVKVLSMSKSFGKDTCVYVGLKHSKSELVCIYDLDTSNTSLLKKMYDYIINNDQYDQVCLYSNLIIPKKIKIFNKIFGLNIDINKTYFRIMKKSVVIGLLELSKKLQFSNYSFELIGFNTYYYKNDIKKESKPEKIKKYLYYSKNPFKFIKYIIIALLIISFLLLLLTIFKIISISNSLLLTILVLLTSLQLSTISFTTNNPNKKECNNYYILKDKIGFDENIL